MTADPGHLLPAEEWARVQRDAKAIAAAQKLKTERGRSNRLRGVIRKLGRSSFPSATGFVQCKYDGGPQLAGGPTFGVLHDAETPLSAGYAASIASYFTRNTNETSAHFMVDPVATIQMLDTSRIAWHCGNGNRRSIGVEQAGYATAMPGSDWTGAAGMQQMARVAALMRDIHAAHGIGLFWMTDQQLRDAWNGQAGGWATHAQCSKVLGGSTHTDPTPNYPYGQLMALANQEDDMPTAQDVAEAVLDVDINGVKLRDRIYGIDSIQLPAIAQAVADVHGKVLTNLDLAGRPTTGKDDMYGHILNTEELARQLAATAGGATDVQALAAALTADDTFMQKLGDAIAAGLAGRVSNG